MIKKLWYRLFLVERSSISLSFFRLAAAGTVGSVVIPTFFHLSDNYFTTAFKTYNTNFFPIWFLEWIQKSPDWLVIVFVCMFCLFWFFFFIGLFSQISCILMVLSCYYFYALNAYHVGTLSWDILLVTLFLMCMTPYHGDYFSVDALRRRDAEAYKRPRPYFLQRLLQLQVGFTFFYTAFYKTTAQGNWITANPIYYIMNYPPSGTAKTFILRDILMYQPEICYWIGISIVVVEFLMIFLLFYHRTRIAAIYLGIVFYITLLLTLDVPATFFFLSPPQLLLFINPDNIMNWIEGKRTYHQSAQNQRQLIYDGNCQFCQKTITKIKVMDLWATLKFINFHDVTEMQTLHPELTEEKVKRRVYLIDERGRISGGFDAFRKLSLSMPMLYPVIPIFFFPGMRFFGNLFYRFFARHRKYL